MNYIKISTKEIITLNDIFLEHPNIQFPNILTDDILKKYDYAILYDIELPITNRYERIEETEDDKLFGVNWDYYAKLERKN